MNLQAMTTLIYRYGFDPGDPVTSVLNASMHEIETMYDWTFLERGPYSIALNPGQSSVPIAVSDFRKVITLKDIVNNIQLKWMSRHEWIRTIQDDTQVGNPIIFTILASNTLQVWPVPLVDATLQLYYQGLTADMVNPTDVPQTITTPWPSYMHMPIVFRAAAILLQMENEEDRAKTAQDQFRGSIMAAMGADGERQLDEVDTVQDDQGYGSLSLRSLHGY